MKKLTMILLILALSTACSNAKKDTEETDSNVSMEEKSDDFVVDAEAESLFASEEEVVEEKVENKVEEKVVETKPVEQEDFIAEENVAAVTNQVNEPSLLPTNNGSMGTYKVKKGDTLMLIAFKLYGDYTKWKSISLNNQSIGMRQLKEGMEISYPEVDKKFSWTPQGLPHLIAMGETLGTISSDKYGTPVKWRKIYDNNRPLIKNPNTIYAGFTLYYIPEREIASEK
jgi:nucleoid-associated protein YgaU